MRRKRNSREDGGSIAGILVPIAVFGLVFYVVAFTSLGDRLTAKAAGLFPNSCGESSAVSTFSPSSTDLPGTDALFPITTSVPDPSSAKVTLPRLSLYMLQMGVYSTRENAEEQSAVLKSLGAAGYIYNDNGSYRVIASAYLNENDSQSVKERLEREGYACTVFPLTCSGAELLITTETDKLVPIEKAFEYAGGLLEKLYRYSTEHDAEHRSADQTSNLIAELRLGSADAAAGIIDSAGSNELLMFVYSFLNDVSQILGSLDSAAEGAAYSASLKETAVLCALRYAALLKQICN